MGRERGVSLRARRWELDRSAGQAIGITTSIANAAAGQRAVGRECARNPLANTAIRSSSLLIRPPHLKQRASTPKAPKRLVGLCCVEKLTLAGRVGRQHRRQSATRMGEPSLRVRESALVAAYALGLCVSECASERALGARMQSWPVLCSLSLLATEGRTRAPTRSEPEQRILRHNYECRRPRGSNEQNTFVFTHTRAFIHNTTLNETRE